LADAPTVEEHVESARALSTRAIWRRRSHGREKRGKARGFVIDYVVDTMSGRRAIEQASDGLRDIGVVTDRHALRGREVAQHRDHLFDVWIAVAAGCIEN